MPPSATSFFVTIESITGISHNSVDFRDVPQLFSKVQKSHPVFDQFMRRTHFRVTGGSLLFLDKAVRTPLVLRIPFPTDVEGAIP